MSDDRIDLGRVKIFTPRFLLRSLTVNDASTRYSAWLDEQSVSAFIHGSSVGHSVEQLREYIKERLEKENVLFLGIFDKESLVHVGNIKYEPIDPASGYAFMGILIGESSWRGKGVAPEVITFSAQWLHNQLGINEIILGVDINNRPAIRAYKKAGFEVQPKNESNLDNATGITMVLKI